MAEITGTAGDDSLVGTVDQDFFVFSLGNDTLAGGGNDVLSGSLPDGAVVDLAQGFVEAPGLRHIISGFRNVFVESGNATLRGDDASNSLLVENGTAELYGGVGNDALSFENTNGVMYGEEGNDHFSVFGSSAGHVSIEGGSGRDRLEIFADIDEVSTMFNAQNQVVLSWNSNQITLLDEIEDFELTKSGEFYSYEDLLPSRLITGTDVGEIVTGTAGKDQIDALGGNDWITTGGGEDTIDGGAGIDTLSLADAFAQPGNGIRFSSMNLEEGFVQVTNPGPVGTVGNERSLISNIENLTGTSRADLIRGDAGANILRGLGGRDDFYLSAGGDLIDGGAGRDTVRVAQGDAQDSSISLLRGRVWEGTGEGTRLQSIESIISGNGNDMLTGSHANNHIRAGYGDDTLMGNGGDDRLYGGFGDDVALFSYAQDQYAITTAGEVTTVSYIGAGAGDGTDTLLQIETLRFADGDLVL